MDFVDLDEGVPVFHGFLDFRGTPFSSERTLLEGVVTETIFLAGVWTFPLPCRLDRVGTWVCLCVCVARWDGTVCRVVECLPWLSRSSGGYLDPRGSQ